MSKSGILKVNVSLSASYSVVSAELEFNPPTVTDLNRSLTFLGVNAKTVSEFIKGGDTYLNRTGQCYSGIWNIGYDTSQESRTNATNTVIFKYSSYNQLQNKVYNTEWNSISFTTGSV